jgi:hypothetical protein
MSEKLEFAHERISHDSPVRKTSVSHSIPSHAGKAKSKKAGEVARIDKLATSPGVTAASFAHLDEKKILRKMDWHLIPMLALLYLLSFLDRGNIGNAKIEGLQETLGMSNAQYNWCLTAFFFTYASCQLPRVHRWADASIDTLPLKFHRTCSSNVSVRQSGCRRLWSRGESS